RSSAGIPPARPAGHHHAGARSAGGFLPCAQCGWRDRTKQASSWVGLQQCGHAFCGDIAEGVVIDHQRRRLVAVAQAAHRQQGEAIIRGGLPRPDAQLTLDAAENVLMAADIAGHAVANTDDVAAYRLAEYLAVEGGYTFDVTGGNTKH